MCPLFIVCSTWFKTWVFKRRGQGSAVQLCTFRGGNRVRKVHNGGQFRKTCVTKEHELLYHEEYSLRNRKTIHASCVHLNSQSTGGDQRNLFWFRSDFLEIRWKKTKIIHKYNYFFKAYITNNGKKKLLNIFFSI